MHQLAVKPILNPSCVFVFVVNNAFSSFQKSVVHFAFGGVDERHVKSTL